ncbi:MAG: HisA/HisF-related TIM barrel protein [Alphaproteobacteria bacterium]
MRQFIIYPAIDMKNGKVVRLRKGNMAEASEYSNDPLAQAKIFYANGARWLHLVNLDAAVFDNPDGKAITDSSSIKKNYDFVKKIIDWRHQSAKDLKIQLGGGIKTSNDAKQWLATNIDRIIIGTLAAEKPQEFEKLLRDYPQKISLAIDVKDGLVMTSGWLKTTGLDWKKLLGQLSLSGLASIIYTDIGRDGTGAGVNIADSKMLKEFLSSKQHSQTALIASGGVKVLADVKKIKNEGFDGIIIGRALYEKTIKLQDALALM